MLDKQFLMEWLGNNTSPQVINAVIQYVMGETKERLLKNEGSETDYGYSFPGVDVLKRACLSEIRSQFVKTGKRPVVADIGAGFGTMTWKLLAAGAQVDAIEIQEPSAKELHRRVSALNPGLWEGSKLDQILNVMPGNALKILNDDSFHQKYDYVWISQVIHFLTPDEVTMLKAILDKILKPGGKVFAFINSIHQFDAIDAGKSISTNFEKAKLDEVFCPGFMTVNAMTLKDSFLNRILRASVVSSFNQIQMQANNIPVQVNAYKEGFLGSTEDATIAHFNEKKMTYQGVPVTVNRFYQVMNLFDPQTAKLSFRQNGFAVQSFYYDGATDKKPLSKKKTDNVAVIVLMQKEGGENLRPSISQSLSLFEPAVTDKLEFAIGEVNDRSIQQELGKIFSNKNYSLLLRTSSARCIFSVVKILLKHSEELGIKINGQSSNGNTALDWAFLCDDKNPEKSKIIKLLSVNDAKKGAELTEEMAESKLVQ
jgi:SAM-dependent methyltransferase